MGTLATGDLTTLATAKAYVGAGPNDTVMTSLITRVSRSILSYINRPLIVPTSYFEKYNGQNTDSLVLFNWPVISIAQLTVNSVNIPSAMPPTETGIPTTAPWGYRFAPPEPAPPGAAAVVELVGGWRYWYGRQNIVTSYRAGYVVSNELWTIPDTPYQVTPVMPFGQWATDEGVDNITLGIPMVAVSAPATPATNQYIPPNPSVGQNYYAFSSEDVGTQISLSYGYIPADIEQAVLETIAERAAYRTRPGVRSQSLAGQETISYGVDNRVGFGLSSYVMDILDGYCNVLPPPIGADV